MAGAADSEFKVIKTLGEGAFGKVFLVCQRGNPTEKYAMKVIDLTKSTEDERELAAKEARLLSDFRHEHILRYVESFEKNGALCIVTEFCDGGDMSEELQKQNGVPLSEPRIVEWFRQTCSALEYLHGRQILHRDMKTQNIFLTGNEKIAKLGDLGLAKVLERPNAKAVTFCGSPYYMSPEIFACKPYDTKSDIWALGVCVYEMATLERPFDAMLMQQLVFKIVHDQLPDMPTGRYSEGMIRLMKRMLDRNPTTRPSAKELMEDPLFKNTPKPTIKSPPPIPPKPKLNAFAASGRSFRDVIQASGLDESFEHVNDMDLLLQTLSQVYSQNQRKAAEKQYDGLSTILAATHLDTSIKADSFVDKTKDLDKTLKGLKSPRLQKGKDFSKSSTLVQKDFDSSTSSNESVPEQQQANDKKVLNLVVHTLTHLFPKDADGESSSRPIEVVSESQREKDPETMLLYQIEQLQQHCARILGMEKFQRAYDMLDAVNDEMELEEKLIKLLTIDKFSMVGVQLFYCKNFEYNLMKLQKQQASDA